MQTLQESAVDLPRVLEYARQNGSVRVSNDKGQAFLVTVEQERSPLDVPGVDTDMTMEEIIDIIHEMRSAGYEDAPSASVQSAQNALKG